VPGSNIIAPYGPGWARILTHLHLRAYNSSFWRDHLAFRDVLRAQPAAARAYESLKRALAASHTSRRAYTNDKTAFIREVLAGSRRE
jgi:GrpB-like predicted nucleotidyltransferase (UPF0157 family)